MNRNTRLLDHLLPFGDFWLPGAARRWLSPLQRSSAAVLAHLPLDLPDSIARAVGVRPNSLQSLFLLFFITFSFSLM
jgi:hypothetical protein